MIIVDTDVFSAIMKGNRDIAAWLDRQPLDEVHLCAVSWFEVLSGIEEVQAPLKRRDLRAAARVALGAVGHRIVPFDESAANVASDLYGERRRRGLVVGIGDTQIAGIAVSRDATLATRNVKHFSDLSIPVVNPWEA